MLDPRQHVGVSKDLISCNILFDDNICQELQQYGQWTIFWKLTMVPGVDFNLLSWWHNASLSMGMPALADHTITASTIL